VADGYVILTAVAAPSSSDQAAQPETHSIAYAAPRGRAEARRVTSAGLADLTERQAEAVAALDRALEARLGELDRAFATRRTQLDGSHLEAEGKLAEIIHSGVAEFKYTASGERRLLQEEAASGLAVLEDAVHGYRAEFEAVVAAQRSALNQLADRVRQLEHIIATRLGTLEEQVEDR
jgi:hypothetical protein